VHVDLVFYQKTAVARKDASARTAAIHHDKNILLLCKYFFTNQVALVAVFKLLIKPKI
jgi:hypothetical protein